MTPGPGLTDALADAHAAVEDTIGELRQLGERHAADHDVLLMSRTLALKLEEARNALAGVGARLGRELPVGEPDLHRSSGPLAPVRRMASGALASRPSAGALLLQDLRSFLVVVVDAAVACVILGQGATGLKDAGLAGVAGDVHELLGRTHRWALTRLKTTAPQVVASATPPDG
jgi:hypothetical protein